MTSGILELYVLGLASEKECRELEHLAGKHPELKKEISTIQKALDEYAKLHRVQPPEELRHKLEQRLNERPPARPISPEVAAKPKPTLRAKGFRMQWKHLFALAAVLMAIVAIGAGVLAFDYNHRLSVADATISDLKKDLNTSARELEQLKNEQAILKERLAFLSSINTLQVRLNATRKAKAALVLIYWNADQQRAFAQWDLLPELPEGKKYRLWAVANRKFEPLAELTTPASPAGEVIQIAFVPGASSFLVTLEKVDGPDYPDLSRMYLQGTLN